MRMVLRVAVVMGAFAASPGNPAWADVVLSGPTSNAGSYSTADLAAVATPGDTVTAGGLTGISLWGLLGGANAANPNSPIYGAITTNTPAGFNGKNSILRYYMLATSLTGAQSIVSLGEIDPNFGGTVTNPSSPAFIAFKTTSGPLLSDPQLVIPGAAGRGLTDVANLQLLSVAALPSAGQSASTAIALSGLVNDPGTYTITTLQNNFTPVTESVQGGTYTGVPLWTFLNPSDSDSRNQLVITQATDGYEVVLSLAELDPSLGGNPDNILPYAGTSFPNSALARTIFPDDTAAHGRWQSNLNAIIVTEVPEPGTLALLALPLALFAAARRARATQTTVC